MNQRLKRTALSVAVATIIGMPVSGTVFAQDGNNVLETVIVTARKVEESVQDISLSISAFTSEDISTRSIEQLEDIAAFTPGLSFEDYSNGGFGTPTIRGASQLAITQLEQNVATFIDGVYIPRQYAVDIGTIGLQRVEVVKGPQSALYGANAFLGAINYVTATADLNELQGNVSVTVGSDERQDISGAISIPVVEGKLAVRLAASVSEFDGDHDNNFPNAPIVNPGTNGKIGGWDNSSYELDIVAQPTDDLKIDIGYSKFDVLSETKPQSRLDADSGDTNCGGRLFGGFGPQTTFCGELPSTPVLPGTDTPTGFTIDPRTFGIDSDSDVLTVKAAFDITDSTTLTYLYGDIQGEVFSNGNSDRDALVGSTSPFLPFVFNSFTQNPIGNFDYTSHELRVEITPDDGISGMLGVFYSEGTDEDESSFGSVPIFAPIVAITDRFFSPFGFDAVTDTEVTAVFGRVSVPLSDVLVFAAEARYTDETKTLVNNGVLQDPFNDDYITSRISLDYNVSDESLLYVSAAQGVKSGGINIAGLDLILTEDELFYGADENTTYELGSKNTFLDGKLQLNAAVYLVDWADLQISTAAINSAQSPDGAQDRPILTNIGSAESVGFEIDTTYAVTDALTLNASLALNDATYDEGTVSQRIVRINLCGDGSCPIDGNLGGNALPRSSDTQWNIGAMYEGTVAGADYFLRADFSGQSEQFVSELNTATIPSRELLNLRAGLSNENWSAELWVTNATDEEYVSNAFFIPLTFAVDYVPSFGNKRRIGLTVDYTF